MQWGMRFIKHLTHKPSVFLTTRGVMFTFCLFLLSNIDVRGQADNDDFANRQSLSGYPLRFEQYGGGATLELGEPICGTLQDLDPIRSLWWSWTAPADGLLRVYSLVNAVCLYDGRQIDQLVSQGTPEGDWVSTSVLKGMEYQLQCLVTNNATGLLLQSRLHFGASFGNDDIQNAYHLEGGQSVIYCNNLGATIDAQEPLQKYSAEGRSVWFRWTAPKSGATTIDLAHADFLYFLGVYSGDLENGLTSESEHEGGWHGSDGENREPAGVAFEAEAGNDYYIAVSSRIGWEEGTFGLQLLQTPLRIIVPESGLRMSTSTPRNGETVRIDLQFEGATNSTEFETISLIHGSSFDETVVATWKREFPDSHEIEVPAGRHQFHLRGVARSSDAPRQHNSSIWAIEVIRINDEFTNRWDITEDGVQFDFGGSTVEPNEPLLNVDEPPPYGTLWWTWTAPESGWVRFVRYPTHYDGEELFLGDQLSQLIAVDRIEGGDYFAVQKGTTYQIRTAYSSYPASATIDADFHPFYPNDNFEDRLSLIGDSHYLDLDTIAATVEATEDSSGLSAGTVWYSWTSSATGRLFIDSRPKVGVYQGETLDGLEELPMPTEIEAGAEYQIRASGVGALDLSFHRYAENDDFVNRTMLKGDSGEAHGDSRLATTEPGEPRIYTGGTLWYSWQAPANGVLEFDAFADVENQGREGLYTEVYIGNSLADLDQLATDDSWGYGRGGASVEAGNWYQIRVQGHRQRYDFTLEFAFHQAPSNDNLLNASLLEGTFIDFSATLLASSFEDQETASDGVRNGHSIWWKWVAPFSGEVSVSTTKFGVSIAAFTGSLIDNIEAVPDSLILTKRRHESWNTILEENIAFFSVQQGQTYLISAALERRTDWRGYLEESEFQLDLATSKVVHPIDGTNVLFELGGTFNAEVSPPTGLNEPLIAFVDWYLVDSIPAFETATMLESNEDSVYRYNLHAEDSGPYALLPKTTDVDGRSHYLRPVEFRLQPANDDFVNRLELGSRMFTQFGTVSGSTLEAGEPKHTQDQTASVWYSWTAPRSGRAYVNFHSIWGDVFTGDQILNLKAVEHLPARDWELPADLIFEAVEGVKYQIGAFGASYKSRFRFELNLETIWANFTGTKPEFHLPEDVEFNIKTSEPSNTIQEAILLIDGTEHGKSAQFPFTFSAAALDEHPGVYQIVVAGLLVTGEWIESNPVEVRVAPENDLIQNATPILADSARFSGTMSGASVSPGDPSSNPNTWHVWTALENGFLRLFPTPSYKIQLFEDTDVTFSNEIMLVSVGSRSTLNVFPVRRGITYSICVSGSGNRDYQIFAELFPDATNDTFANRAVINGIDVSFSQVVAEATFEPNEPVHEVDSKFDGSIWWHWDAPSEGLARIGMDRDARGYALEVYTGETLGTLHRVTTSRYTFGDVTYIEFEAQANQGYQLAAIGQWPTTIEADLSFCPVPTSDAFVQRSVLQGRRVEEHIYLVSGTLEPGEPSHSEQSGSGSLWWSWTAEATTTVHLESNYWGDAALAVYVGNRIDSLKMVTQGRWEPAVWTALAGETYQIVVERLEGTARWLTLHLVADYAPSNDDFENREQMVGNRASVSGWNRGSSREWREPDHAEGTGGATVWYTWTPETTGIARLKLEGEIIQPVIAAYSGSAIERLLPIDVAIQDQAYETSGTLEFMGIAGEEYQIAIDGLWGAEGDFNLELETNTKIASVPIDAKLFVDSALLSIRGFFVYGSRVILFASPDLTRWHIAAEDFGLDTSEFAFGVDYKAATTMFFLVVALDEGQE